ncbi:MAG: class D beta-lactamase [Chlamydiae bacterium]|nr:class D beta-lactamase [Chlamydiota bacterium]
MQQYRKLFCCLFVLLCANCSAEESFLLVHGNTSEVVLGLGPDIDKRISPCSTFKIPLSLMGYDKEILKNKTTPAWHFQAGYDDYLASWRATVTPKTWMQYSCVWYSKVLSLQLGEANIQHYLTLMEYGNKDTSTGLVLPGQESPLWINSSLTISLREQVDFIRRMLLGNLSVSPYAVQETKALLYKEELFEGWRLFGKTGWSGAAEEGVLEHGWFIGWIEKDHLFFPFAYLIREQKIDLGQRIPRVKQLLGQVFQGEIW